MIIGYARVSTTEQNLGLRYDDVKPAFDASVDQTELRKATARRFGRSDRRTQRYWPCESLPRKDRLERGRGDFADKEGIAGSALIYSAGYGMRENVLTQQVEVPRRGPPRSRSRVHLWPFFPWFLTAGAAHE